MPFAFKKLEEVRMRICDGGHGKGIDAVSRPD